VPVSESNLLAYLDNIRSIIDIGPGDRCSQVFDLTFDLSVHDIFLTWTSGACLVIPEEQSPLFFYKYIRDKHITAWFSVPSTIQLFEKMRLLKPGSFPYLKTSLFCGEALPSRLAMKWLDAARDSRVINLYGPTEATIAISYYEIPRAGQMLERNGVASIGKVFDGHKHKTGDGNKGVQGELLLSGPQVVKGYYMDKEQTGRAFTDIDGDTYYLTGDIVEKDEEGTIYFMGRKDHEIKLHGYRINLLEIDYVISEFLGGEPVVDVLAGEGTSGVIICFALENIKKTNLEKDILEHCREKLPWYMVPEKVIFVKEFPLNVNGKTDRGKLLEKYNEGS
jgi:acyl-coenzyme A synthetase/AMP-(fatty) acid ligase